MKGRRSSRSVRAFERLDVIIAAALVESSSLRFAFLYLRAGQTRHRRSREKARSSLGDAHERSRGTGEASAFRERDRWWPSRGRRRRGPVSRPRARDVTTRRAGEDPRLRRRRLVRVDAERPRTKTRLPRGLSKIPRRRAHLPRRARPAIRAARPSRTRTRHTPGNASTGRTRASARPAAVAVKSPRVHPKKNQTPSPRLRIDTTCAKRSRT